MNSWLLVLGGVGLFLTGMVVMTEGLKAMAGRSLRHMLAERTNSPLSGAITGAITTAVVQSSSATTVTAVGFVGAGILTFSQSLGIIFGANIGTTLTGWLVAILGFKVKLGLLALPFTFAGVLLKLYGRGVYKNAGWALVGFSLLFMGISTMQSGTAGFEGQLVPSSFPPDTMWGRLQLLGLGMLVTLVTQSSSAGVATVMVMLGSGAINFTQGAAMVIGMDVGTTFTAALATVGGSVPMRRTGYAHVIYNLMTGILAFLLLSPAVAVLSTWGLTTVDSGGAQMGLALYHSLFNAAGVLLILPVTNQFAKLVKRMVPDETHALSNMLDKRFLKEPAAAVDTSISTILQIRDQLYRCLDQLLTPEENPEEYTLQEIEHAMGEAESYFRQINVEPETEEHLKLVDAIHTLDHLRRLHRRCMAVKGPNQLARDWRLQRLVSLMRRSAVKLADEQNEDQAVVFSERLRRLIHAQEKRYRLSMLHQASGTAANGEDALRKLDAMRWLQRVSHHLWRIETHARFSKQDKLAALSAVKHHMVS